MADANRKRSRKSRLVPRNLDSEADGDITKKSTLQILSKLNSAMDQAESSLSVPFPDSQEIGFSIKVEVECEDLTAPDPDAKPQAREDRATSLSEVVYVKTADIRKEVEKTSKTTTSAADKLLEVEIRNSWGKDMKPIELSPLETRLQEVLMNWRAWNSQSRVRDTPLFYKCYACDIGFWQLAPFRDHLARHENIKIHHETFHHEYNVIAWVGDEIPRLCSVRIVGGNCGACQYPAQDHIGQHRSSIYYYCLGCKDKFFACLSLFNHESKCQRYLQHLVNNGTVIHENKWICKICNLDCLTETRYEGHMIGRHSPRSDCVIATPLFKVCQSCGMKYFLHNMHACSMRPQSAQCTYCFRKFQNKPLLALHRLTTASTVRCAACDHFVPRRCMEVEHVLRHSRTYCLAFRCAVCPESLLFPTQRALYQHLGDGHGFKVERKRLSGLVVIVPKSIERLPQLDFQEAFERLLDTGPEPQESVSESQLADGEMDDFELKSEIKIEEHELIDETETDGVSPLRGVGGDEDDEYFKMQNEINKLLKRKKRRKDRIPNITEVDLVEQVIETEVIDNTELTEIIESDEMIFKTERRDSLEEECGLIEGQIQEMLGSSEREREDSAEKECQEMQDQIDSLLKRQKKNWATKSKAIELNQKTTSKDDEECELIQEEIDSLIRQREKRRSMLDQYEKEGDTIYKRVMYGDSDDSEELECDWIEQEYKRNLQASKKARRSSTKSNQDSSVVKSVPFNVKQEKNKSHVESADSKVGILEAVALANVKAEIQDSEMMEDHDFVQSWSNVYQKPKHPDIDSANDESGDKEASREESSDDEDDLIILNSDNHNFVDLTEEVDEQTSEPNSDDVMNDSLESKDLDEDEDRQNDSSKKLYMCKKCDYAGIHKDFVTHKAGVCRTRPRRPPASTLIDDSIHPKFVLKSKEKGKRIDPNAQQWPKFRCSSCKKSYRTLRKYLLHFCPDTKVETEDLHNLAYGQCPKCFVVVDNLSKLCLHVVSHIKASFIPMQRIATSLSLLKKDGMYSCLHCKDNIPFIDFFQHWESHLEEVTVNKKPSRVVEKVNEDCTQTKNKLAPEKLKRILGQLTTPRDCMRSELKSCVACKRPFDRRNDCRRHLIEHLLRDAYAAKLHHGQFICQICGEAHEKPDSYKQHMRGHGGLPIYKCDICNKDFSDSSNFTKHKKVHNLDVLVCDLCNKKFQAKVSLEKHLKLHETLEPVQCKICDKEYLLPSALKKHMKATHASSQGDNYRFSCVYCGQRFYSLRHKWDHMWEIHRQRKQKADCPVCGRAFRKLQDVKRHLKEVHGQSLTCLIYNTRLHKPRPNRTRVKKEPEPTGSVKNPLPAVPLSESDLMIEVERCRLRALRSSCAPQPGSRDH